MRAEPLRARPRWPHLLCLLTALLTLSPPLPARADLINDGFHATYTVIRNGLRIGVAERRLQPAGNADAEFTSEAYPTGLAAVLISDHVRERSVWRHDRDSGVQPIAYSYDQSGGRRERHYQLYFDHQRGVVASSVQNRRYPLKPDTYDTLVFQLALMEDLAAGQRSIRYAIVDRKKIADYRLQVAGDARLETALGNMRTVKVVQQAGPSEDVYTFWCAPQLDYLPVRIERREDDGDTVVMELRELTRRAPNSAGAG